MDRSIEEKLATLEALRALAFSAERAGQKDLGMELHRIVIRHARKLAGS